MDLTVETPNLEVLKRLDWKPAIGMGLESSHSSAHKRGRRLIIASLTLSRIEGSGTMEALPLGWLVSNKRAFSLNKGEERDPQETRSVESTPSCGHPFATLIFTEHLCSNLTWRFCRHKHTPIELYCNPHTSLDQYLSHIWP